MQKSPFPCFFGINETQNLGADNLELERTSVTLGLEACSPEAHPLESYSLVKRFLQAHTVKTRYDLFRSAIEKLLLWCLLLARKPIVSLNEVEIRQLPTQRLGRFLPGKAFEARIKYPGIEAADSQPSVEAIQA